MYCYSHTSTSIKEKNSQVFKFEILVKDSSLLPFKEKNFQVAKFEILVKDCSLLPLKKRTFR